MILNMYLDNNTATLDGDPDSPTELYLEIFYSFDPVDFETKVKNFRVELDVEGPNSENLNIEIVEPGGDADNVGEPIFIDKRRISNLMPGSEYIIALTVYNLRKATEHFLPFKTPLSPKPYDSWIWSSDDYSWVPPITKPEPVWDEKSSKWILP